MVNGRVLFLLDVDGALVLYALRVSNNYELVLVLHTHLVSDPVHVSLVGAVLDLLDAGYQAPP